MNLIPIKIECMKTLGVALLLACGIVAVNTSLAAENVALDEHLEPLRPFLGKTWKGHFKNSTPEKPMIDISRWERALNGKAVRILHSINHGQYGGETLIVWDAAKQSLVYFYFTTAGFRTTGTMTLKDKLITSHEFVTGGTAEGEGVTEVRATSELRPDGTLHVKSEYLKKGEWVAGHDISYREDAKAEVLFK